MATTQQEGKRKDKALTGDAGAHYVAFRLATMEYAVGLTTHGTRAIDLFVAKPDTGKSIAIQTKTMRDASVQSRKWGHYWKWRAGKSPGPVHEIFFCVFVDLKGGPPETPDVYIVPSPRLDSLLNPYKTGGDWYVIEEKDAPKYKERWDIIRDALA